jgi:hypothetical protein
MPDISPKAQQQYQPQGRFPQGMVSSNPSETHNVSAARRLAAAVLLVAIVSSLPAGIQLVAAFRGGAPSSMPRWCYLLLAVAILEAAYALYLYLLPDVSSLWVVTWFCLVLATVSALLFGLTYAAGNESPLIQQLELGEGVSHAATVGWCFLMLALNGLLAYLGGRSASVWHRNDVP